MRKPAWFFLIFYVLLLAFSPLQSFAQPIVPTPPSSETSSLSLTPPDTDLSVGYLSNIFGSVDGVLNGTGSQLLGAMFGVFNGAVLVLGGIVILYTLFVGTLNTASEGEMLGKNWSSIWIPLRSVIGIALLIPKATGYSFIQIFMVWIAVMGIGAADSVWNRALDYFLQGGMVITQNQQIKNIQGSASVTSAAASMLNSLTCVSMLQKQLENYRNTFSESDPNRPPPVPNFYAEITTSLNNQLGVAAGSSTIDFPTLNPNNPVDAPYANLDVDANGNRAPVCGSVTWQAVGNNAVINALLQNNDYSNIKTAILESRAIAVAAMIQNLYGVSGRIVTNFKNTSVTGNKREPLGYIIYPSNGAAGNPPYVWGAGTVQNKVNYLLGGTTISNAVNTYFGIMAPTLNLMNAPQNAAAADAWVKQAKSNGWVLAGRFYFDIIALNGASNLSESATALTVTPALSPSASAVVTHFQNGAASPYVTDMQELLMGSSDYDVAVTGRFIKDSIAYGNSLTYGNVVPPTGGGGSPDSGNEKINQMLGPLYGLGAYLRTGLLLLQTSQATGANPIVAIATLGDGLVNTIFWVFVGLAVTVFGIGILMAAVPFVALAAALISAVMVVVAFITPILIPLMVVGLVMVFYIPMIPFIIFLFGVIGWFIAVIEAVIAAPLVALGIAHPEGQPILGKAEPAVMLLVNVFLRPTFMIFGMLIGMMLSYVGIWLLNQGFANAFQEILTQATSAAVSGIFAPIAYVVIYVLIVMQIVQKSFTLIFLIPDEVLKWIGGNIRGMGGEEAAEQKIAGGYHSAAEAQASMVSKAPEFGKGAGEAVKGIKEGGQEIASGGGGGANNPQLSQGGGGSPGPGATPTPPPGLGSGTPPVPPV